MWRITSLVAALAVGLVDECRHRLLWPSHAAQDRPPVSGPRRLAPMGRLLHPQQHAGRPQHSHRVGRRRVRLRHRRVGPARTAKNIKWVCPARSQTYGNAGRRRRQGLRRHQQRRRLARALSRRTSTSAACSAFDAADGKFLWQHSSEKLPTGRVHDWPLQGICCAPLVEGDRLWFVTSRGEVGCLDTEGFHDGENDGPFTEEEAVVRPRLNEADVVWVFDMMKELGVSQHNMCSCSVTAAGDILFVNTSNGVDESHINYIPAPEAPSFIAIDKNTGKVLWTDNSPGLNILHGQWSSPPMPCWAACRR